MAQQNSDLRSGISDVRLDHAILGLVGIVEGISIDEEINLVELDFLKRWLAAYRDAHDKSIFGELIPLIEEAMESGIITADAHDNILRLRGQLGEESGRYDAISTDVERLRGIMGGILADCRVTDDELYGLRVWLRDHDHLEDCWPYNEINTIVANVLSDGRIDDGEQELLKRMFTQFAHVG